MRVLILLLIWLPLSAFAATEYVQVEGQNAYVYEEPDKLSPILRRLYSGEIVKPVERISTSDGYKWVRVALGSASGYVSAEQLDKAAGLPETVWAPQRVLRHEMPLSLAFKGGGELFGAGLNLRHMSLTRLGLSFSVGPVLDHGAMKGTAMSGGVVMCTALSNLSPIVETGFTRLSYHDAGSTLRMSAYYLSGGLEWMFGNGIYADLGVTYVRSMDVEIVYEYEDVRDGQVSVGSYGIFGAASEGASFQAARPMLTVGFAF